MWGPTLRMTFHSSVMAMASLFVSLTDALLAEWVHQKGLLCAQHFPYPIITGSSAGSDVFDDTYRHHRMTVREVNEQYAAMYYPMNRDQAMHFEVQMVGRCCACSREEDLTRCMNRFCLHLACPDRRSSTTFN
eukprot:6490993-Amphidinium_carterae.2